MVDGKKESDAMERAMYMDQMAEHGRAKLLQNNTNIQLYSELYNKLHEDVCKKLTGDPLWEEVERKQVPKGLMIAVTKIIILASSGKKHQDTHRARMMHHAIRQNDKESLQDYYSRTTKSLATQHLLSYKPDSD